MAEYIDRDTLRDALCETDAITMRGLEILNQIPAADVVSRADFEDCRNELCYRCGDYKRSHLGACSDCRWRPERWEKNHE